MVNNPHINTAIEMQGLGFNCAQAVLSAECETLNLPTEQALRVAAPLGGGIGRQGLTCGAVTGAILALGLRWGSTDPTDKAAKELLYAKTQEFCRRFTEQHGSIQCSALVCADMMDPEQVQNARERGVFKTLCPQLVISAVEILDEILAEA